jgi:NADH:ubiquinone oxidoreductase subunit C
MDRGYTHARNWSARAGTLKQQGWWLSDLCGVDRLGLVGLHRFQVAYQFLHHERKERMSLYVSTDADPPAVPSVVKLWPTAAAMEREAYDMFGIVFEGHPDLTRILMPDDWEGHPLRKDYGVGKVPVEFVPQPFLQIDAPGQAPDTEEARRDVDRLGQAGRPRRELGNAPGAGEPKGAS